ncbi:replication factor C subunit 3-like [Quercus robur]|uniref:replication factor C subunit 3-like n=1 Tax=Quercus robur TaxID=38942 RepID=UPI002163253D|nr:replication factor C subunit 3-like [Quercus robur]
MIQKPKEAAAHIKAPSIGELNEMIAKAKLSTGQIGDDSTIESTDSILPGDIFFSHQHIALAKQKDVLPKTNGFEIHDSQSPKLVFQRDAAAHQRLRANDNFDHNARGTSSSAGLSQTINSSSGISGESSDKFSTNSSKMSDTSRSMTKFTANRRKSQTDAWTFVVESLRQFWADKHQPGSLNEFTCHKQEAQLLKKLVSHDVCPHILFKGSSGSGKRALTMALLHEIYGDACWNLSHDLRYFQIQFQRLPPKSSATAHFTYQQERRPMQVVVPLTSSPHHVELNVNLEANAKYALMGLVKKISSEFAVIPEVSNVNFKAKYKVIVFYEVDKATENIQHLIKWIMDCYGDACKLILCCEDGAEILESVKDRCKVIKVNAPVTYEIMKVLIQIARKEDFDLPMSFAAKIATKLKQNLRKAIMAMISNQK